MLKEYITAVLSHIGFVWADASLVYRTIWVLLILLLAWLADLLCRRIIIPLIKAIVAKTEVSWDDVVFNDKVLKNFCHIVPSIVAYMLFPFAFSDAPVTLSFLMRICEVYIIASSLRLVSGFIGSLYLISETRNVSRTRPLKGIYQMLQVLVIFVGVILIISVLIGKSPLELFVGLGAAATVLMLIFKDTIVGLVSGVQLSANDMLRPGDWIKMPKHGVNGIVFEVNLTTVKVRNWDNTISTIPPYTLVSETFENWRGMAESGGRRVSRSVYIDMSTVRFLSPEEKEKYRRNRLIGEEEPCDELTNLTMLRRHLVRYIENNGRVNTDMTFMVRHLDPTPQGIPLELYFFSANKEWVKYENLQADVFDYVMAIVPEFGLKIFQTVMPKV
ncbi:MAG: mechanosensitive ion channel family protein [Bacteroides sp.]|nr:mechanosensitive ion channel family protein [Roseburia sp.]MCM1346729.1 mechanosensitive ion channel family protein [Bacteroides sp.]MCM1421291.1 mechanosensitive ion channel family protein [Bacteroides sp.]